MSNIAILALEDGTIFQGKSIGAPGSAVGEVVFNTAMSGYQEILTDPSYAGQMVCLTSAHVGNVGINVDDMESSSVQAEGLILRAYSPNPSSWRSEQNLGEMLKAYSRPGISDIDTRQLTRHLRECGSLGGCLTTELDAAQAVEKAREFPGLLGMDLTGLVSSKEIYDWDVSLWGLEAPTPRRRVVVYDFGVKRNILRTLVSVGCSVVVVPAKTSFETVAGLEPDGIVLSNGPGDPAACRYAISSVRKMLESDIPVLGICLGHQLLAIASGARTVKMPFGHHGANHPVLELDTGQVWITSQNHGFAVEADDIPDHLAITHRSLFDNSVQGIARKDVRAIGFQGHPEASPGPHDAYPLFEKFMDLMESPSCHAATI